MGERPTEKNIKLLEKPLVESGRMCVLCTRLETPPVNACKRDYFTFCQDKRPVPFLPLANEVWGKVIFSQASVCSQEGVCGRHPPGQTPPKR